MVNRSDIKGMTSDEALAVIDAMPIGELAAMTRDAVHALPAEARMRRRERLRHDDTIYDKPAAAKLFGVTVAALVKWRNRYLKTGVVGRDSMPQSDLDRDRVREHGDGRTDRGAPPRWKGSTLRGWGARPDVGKLDTDFFPIVDRGGRPPKPLTEISPYA